MKRHGNLWESFVSKENLHLAFKKARKNKNWQSKIQRLLPKEDKLIDELHESLIAGTFTTSEYRTKKIFEPKERLIYILPFYPDRVVHHAIMNVLEPIWDNLLISDSYACRVGKGQHSGSRRCMEFVRRFKYCLKCDVSKFYPSVDHAILKAIIRKKLKDDRLLSVLDNIIDSVEGGKNVPIGNFLSQWFGNIYLNELDMWIKHEKKVKPYLRYCDDFCLFSNDKAELHQLGREIKTFCAERLSLRLSKCEVFPTTQGVDFLGYRHFAQGYILVRKSTAKRMFKRLAKIPERLDKGKLTHIQAVSQVASAEGWLKHANAHNLGKALKLEHLKEVLKTYDDHSHEEVQ